MTYNSLQNIDGAFGKGSSGKPKVAHQKATQTALPLLHGQAAELTQRAVKLALAGGRAHSGPLWSKRLFSVTCSGGLEGRALCLGNVGSK